MPPTLETAAVAEPEMAPNIIAGERADVSQPAAKGAHDGGGEINEPARHAALAP